MLNGDVFCKFVQADRPAGQQAGRPAENPFVRVAVATKNGISPKLLTRIPSVTASEAGRNGE